MNPENRGEHIVLRHSSLWRNPLTYEKQVSTTKHCHQQLNESKCLLTKFHKLAKAGDFAIIEF